VIQSSFLFVINPRSGTRLQHGVEQVIAIIEEKVKEAGHTGQCVVTQAAGHATQLAQQAVQSNQWTTIVVVGGDGTVNEVARAMVNSTISLGILPLGSGNGLARHLGIPLTLPESIDFLLQSKPVFIDSATLNGRPFFCVAGLGFDAYVGYLFSQQAQRGWGTYVKVSMNAYWNYMPQRVRVNQEEKQVYSISFANAGQFGNNAWVAPQADLTDGQLEVCTVLPFPKWYGTALTYWLFTKQMKTTDYISYQSLSEIVVETEEPALVHYDGEPWRLNTTRIEVKIIPRSLLVQV